MSSSERPAAAVRMMTPPMKPWDSRNDLTMPRRRERSSRESILRETPTWSTVGMKTRNRPGMVTCDVSRAPLVPSGSLTTWTRTSWPSFSRSSILASGRSRSSRLAAVAAAAFDRRRRGGGHRRGRRLDGRGVRIADAVFRALGAGSHRGRNRRRLVLVVLLARFEAVELLDGVDDLRDVEEGVPFETDVNEGGLHPGEDLGDPPLVDIADNAARSLALDEDLDDLVVFEDGDPRIVVA